MKRLKSNGWPLPAKALILDLAPDAVAEIEFRFATLRPYLTA